MRDHPEAKSLVAGLAVMGACHVWPLPCTYDDSSGRIRSNAGDVVSNLDLAARASSRVPRASRGRTRDGWLVEGPGGRRR